MTRASAMIDAALTVQRWRRLIQPSLHWRFTRYIAHRLGCCPTWDAIEDEIVRRLLVEDLPERRAA